MLLSTCILTSSQTSYSLWMGSCLRPHVALNLPCARHYTKQWSTLDQFWIFYSSTHFSFLPYYFEAIRRYISFHPGSKVCSQVTGPQHGSSHSVLSRDKSAKPICRTFGMATRWSVCVWRSWETSPLEWELRRTYLGQRELWGQGGCLYLYLSLKCSFISSHEGAAGEGAAAAEYMDAASVSDQGKDERCFFAATAETPSSTDRSYDWARTSLHTWGAA